MAKTRLRLTVAPLTRLNGTDPVFMNSSSSLSTLLLHSPNSRMGFTKPVIIVPHTNKQTVVVPVCFCGPIVAELVGADDVSETRLSLKDVGC